MTKTTTRRLIGAALVIAGLLAMVPVQLGGMETLTWGSTFLLAIVSAVLVCAGVQVLTTKAPPASYDHEKDGI